MQISVTWQAQAQEALRGAEEAPFHVLMLPLKRNPNDTKRNPNEINMGMVRSDKGILWDPGE